MHCLEFQHRLDAILDNRENPAADPQLADHATRCHRCRQLLAEHTELFAGLSQIKTPALDVSFARRVVASAVPQIARGTRRSRWMRPVAAILAAAAAMLIALSIVWVSRQRESSLADAEQAPARIRGGFSGFAVATPPYTGRKATAAARPAPPVTIADVLLETPRLPNRLRNYRGALDEFAVALPAAAQRLDEIEQMAPGIRPLCASLEMIWDTLCRTIPTTHSDADQPPRDNTGSYIAKALCLA